MPRISKTLVDSIKPGAARQYVWDDKISGFGLVVHTSGRKAYCYQYRNTEGRTRRISIGPHGDALTADKARKRALKLQGAVLDGADPAAERQARRDAVTVGDLLDAYLDSATFASKAPSTRAIDRGRIERHLKPLLGRKIADKLTADDVRRAQRDIASGKTACRVKTGPRGLARVTGGEGTARVAIRLLKTVFAWAIEDGRLVDNPAAPVKVGQDGVREAVIEPGQYAKLFETIQALEDRIVLRPAVADAIRVIALTGARRGEITGLRWRHVDLKKGLIVLPAGEHKTGRKTSAPRIIGLPTAAQAIIARQPAGDPDDRVFRPAYGNGTIGLTKPWCKIREAAGLDPAIGLHGLRHSLATTMAVNGAQAGQIMAVMGHRALATAQRYVHIAQDARAALAEQAAASVSAALEGKPRAAVKRLPKARRK